ncbi:SDR family NAD(P)-dependent oxidoreductase [Rhodococcus sp. BGS-1C]|jgi:NAD(P)-dependent dehydrogenase (short-subunit alcohol dehydrogenase family)|uniref:short-chain dehydrogenase/reductase n=1 Tax=unclassified Rhodococcus (in: high G+C Gram-positive bacteria) TaxID=192944 RepID=UPI0009599A7E|nr:short-chain dehydrogenase/reductase [Rhodococcus sp. KRD197]OLT32444.1 short-chain dehydrogenase [Rhodococcus sp. CUA-806]
MFPFDSRSPAYDVNGKVVLITGGGQGIGLALARILHTRGASVALVDVDTTAVKSAARTLGKRALPLTADVRDRPRMTTAVAHTVDRFGRLDVVVANAGVAPPPATLRTIDEDDFDRVIAINLTGVFNTVRPALEQVIQHHGHVVVVSSAAAFTPGAAASPYMISKAAVEQLGRALRIELAAVGATAGVAYFGIVETSMTHDSVDQNDLASDALAMLPWPLNQRITAAQAAKSIADGITARAASTIAPTTWKPYSLLRGIANVIIDHRMARDDDIHALVRKVEAQATSTDHATTSEDR